MSIDDFRKQYCEFNIERLVQFRKDLLQKKEDIKTNKKQELEREITELEALGVKSERIKEVIASLKKELEVIQSASTMESLANVQELVERRLAELQILGC